MKSDNCLLRAYNLCNEEHLFINCRLSFNFGLNILVSLPSVGRETYNLQAVFLRLLGHKRARLGSQAFLAEESMF